MLGPLTIIILGLVILIASSSERSLILLTPLNYPQTPTSPLESEKIVDEVTSEVGSAYGESKENKGKDFLNEVNRAIHQKSPSKTAKLSANSGCKCKKSRCLKLDCEFFSANNFGQDN